MAMNTRKTFRKLVTNQYLPNFDYLGTSFTFKTVFSLTTYCYRCCTCAFEHEYFDYIKEDGSIDENMYSKIEDSVINGFCPHVNGVPTHCIRETSVEGLTVAAAAGTLEAMQREINSYSRRMWGIMGVHPYLIAILKNRKECVEVITEDFTNRSAVEPRVVFKQFESEYRRKGNSENKILKEPGSIAETCAENGIINYFKATVLSSNFHPETNDIARCFATTIKKGNTELEEAVIDYILRSICNETKHNHPPMVWKPVLFVLILYNRPSRLRLVLSNILAGCADIFKPSEVLLKEIGEICFILERTECLKIIGEFRGPISPDMSNEKRSELLVSLLHGFYDDFSSEIVSRLAVVQTVTSLSKLSMLMLSAGRHNRLSTALLDKRVLKQLTGYGADLDLKNSGLQPLLSQVLKASITWGRPPHYRNIRTVVEFLISENSSIELNNSALHLALKMDERYAKRKTRYEIDFYGEIIMDSTEHAVSKHDNTADRALNFLGPLLIESGFPVTKETLSNIELQNMPPTEQDYLLKCIKQPRSLMLCCRDVLRRHYSGHKLNRLIDTINIPNKIRDYILLKEILKCDEYYPYLYIEPHILCF